MGDCPASLGSVHRWGGNGGRQSYASFCVYDKRTLVPRCVEVRVSSPSTFYMVLGIKPKSAGLGSKGLAS